MLDSRLKQRLRQEKGRVYDLYCGMHASKAYPTVSWIGTSFITASDQAKKTALEARKTMDTFALKGPSRRELDMAVRKMTEKVRRIQGKTLYWSHILSELTYHHGGLENVRKVCEGYRSITREGMLRLAGRYFVPSNQWQIM